MNQQITGQQVLEDEFLPMRAKILEIAAALDRVQRAPGDVDASRELSLLQSAIDVLREPEPGRAERVQLLFSRPYANDWREGFNLA